MSKFFDIRPPSPPKKQKRKTYKKPKPKKGRSSGSGLLFAIIGICIFIFIFSLTSNTSSTYEQPEENKLDNLIATETTITPSPNPSTTPSKQSTKEIQNENNDTQAKNNNTSESPQVVILNGARIPGIANEVKDSLENNSIKVDEVGNTENPYNSSFIYYTENNSEIAKKIQETISDYNPNMEINSDLANDSKILIVIGANE